MPGTLLELPHGPLVVRDAPPSGPVLSLVVPTYNESKNVLELVRELTTLLEPRLGDRYEIIIVDDDSPDGTWRVAEALSEADPRVRVLRRVGERGLGTAVVRGWQVARGEILGVMDADLQHPPEVNLALLDQIDRGADLATASRHVQGGGVSDWSLWDPLESTCRHASLSIL